MPAGLATQAPEPRLLTLNRAVGARQDLPGPEGRRLRAGSTASQGQPAIIKVKEIRARVTEVRGEVITGKVLVQGTLHKQVFFVDADNIVRHVPEDLSFTQMIEVPGAEPGMEVQLDSQVEHIAFHVAPDGSSIIQKVLVRTRAVVSAEEQLMVVADPLGLLVHTNEIMGQGSSQSTRTAEIPLSPASVKVSEIRALPVVLGADVIEGKVVVQGRLDEQIFFVDEAGQQRNRRAEVPFNLFVEVPGAEPGFDAQVTVQVERIDAELATPTLLRQTVVLRAAAVVTRPLQERLAAGAGPVLKLNAVRGEAEAQFVVEGEATLPSAATDLSEVVTTVSDLSAEVIEEKVIIRGTLRHQIFYGEAATGGQRHAAMDVPFTQAVEVPGAEPGMTGLVRVDLVHVEGVLTDPTTARITAVVHAEVKAVEIVLHPVELGPGPLIRALRFVGEGRQQILVERKVVPPPIILPLPVFQRLHLEEPAEVSAQVLVQLVAPVAAVKVKDLEARARITAVRALDTKILVEGILEVQIHYVDLEDIVRSMTVEQPFQIFVPLPPGVSPEDVQVRAEVEKVLHTVSRDQIKLVAVVRVFAGVTRVAQPAVVVGVEPPTPGVALEFVRVRVEAVRGLRTEVQTLVQELLADPPAAPGPILATVTPTDVTAEAEDGRVRVSGILQKEIEYPLADGTRRILRERAPFELTVAVPLARPDLIGHAQVTVRSVDVERLNDGSRLRVTVTVEVEAKAAELVILQVATGASGPDVVEVVRETFLLDVVDDSIPHPVPTTVVTDLVLRN